MITPPRLRENLRRRFPRARSWWLPAALLALTPKCIACVLGYASLGAMLGIGGPELCGAPGGAYGHWEAWLLTIGTAGPIGVFTIRSRRRNLPPARFMPDTLENGCTLGRPLFPKVSPPS